MTELPQVIQDDLKSRGVIAYSWYPANNCIGVSYDRISCYYYIENDKIVNIIFD